MITEESIKTITEITEATSIRLNQFSETGANCHVDFTKTSKDSNGEIFKTETIPVHIPSNLIGSLSAFPTAYTQLKTLAYAELDKVLAKRAAALLAAKEAEAARKAAELAAAQAIIDAANA